MFANKHLFESLRFSRGISEETREVPRKIEPRAARSETFLSAIREKATTLWGSVTIVNRQSANDETGGPHHRLSAADHRRSTIETRRSRIAVPTNLLVI
jgi:hypothetical protein